jgi:predicted metal-dependent hydrolase
MNDSSSNGTAGFYVRNIIFPLDKSIPKIWIKEDPFLTCYFDAVSIAIPEGESFVNAQINLCKPKIKDETLLLQAKELTAQEAMHSKIHRKFNRHRADSGYQDLVGKLEAINKKGLDWWQRRSFNWRLAFSAAIEVNTVYLGVILLDGDFLKNADERIKTIFIWHCMEESEHKAVAFDVYQYLCGRKLLFFACMLILVPINLIDGLIAACILLKSQGKVFTLKNIKSFGRLYFGRHGLFWGFSKLLLWTAMPHFTPAKFPKIKNYERLKSHYDNLMQ